MNLKTFKTEYLFTPEQFILINRSFELNGDPMHLLALTYEEDSYSLWTMDCLANETEIVNHTRPETYRESYENRSVADIRSIESIEFANTVINFSGASTDYFNFSGDRSLHRLQYFISQGIDLSHWDNVSLKKMQLTKHTSSESSPMLDLAYVDKSIKLKFRTYHKRMSVFHTYSLDFDIGEPVELKYFNPFEEREESFYVNKFEIYGYEDYKLSLETNDSYNQIPKEHLENMMSMVKEYFDGLDQKDSCMVLMTYEADQGLEFHLTEYLDREIERSSSSSSMGFIFNPDEKMGPHGKRMFMACFHDAKKDKLDRIGFELHSVSKSFPEELVVIL